MSAKNAIQETEKELISKAQAAVSQCNWVVGECAAKWTKKYARGRTDADFATLIGMSPDQVGQRRRVWETFGDVYERYASLKWSHFYVALNWDDAPECFQWAEEQQATVAEMKAWRRAMHGEDLLTEAPAVEWSGDPAISFVPSDLTAVRDPSEFDNDSEHKSLGRPRDRRESTVETVAGVARERDSGDDYAPFRRDAGSPAPAESGEVAVVDRPAPSAEQLVKRAAVALERMNAALTPEVMRAARSLPEALRNRLTRAAADLNSKISKLG